MRRPKRYTEYVIHSDGLVVAVPELMQLHTSDEAQDVLNHYDVKRDQVEYSLGKKARWELETSGLAQSVTSREWRNGVSMKMLAKAQALEQEAQRKQRSEQSVPEEEEDWYVVSNRKGKYQKPVKSSKRRQPSISQHQQHQQHPTAPAAPPLPADNNNHDSDSGTHYPTDRLLLPAAGLFMTLHPSSKQFNGRVPFYIRRTYYGADESRHTKSVRRDHVEATTVY